ncbi:MAG: hypothetical protein ACOYNZ_09450 [Rhodoferax sp.]
MLTRPPSNSAVPLRLACGVSGGLQEDAMIFSGSFATVTFNPPRLSCALGGAANVLVTITDEIGNIMPAGTTVKFGSFFGFGTPPLGVFPSSVTVPHIPLDVGQPLVIPAYLVSVACFEASGKFFATVTTPRKIETVISIPIN